ncbi:MAG: hypothetical protein D3922_02485 [Candidatus Electrothrix sp. AR1]|nr:hypothetical protein [Candidatus Electrothrix sp. AR1]
MGKSSGKTLLSMVTGVCLAGFVGMTASVATADTVHVDLKGSKLTLHKYRSDRLKVKGMEGLSDAIADEDGFTLMFGADLNDPAFEYSSDGTGTTYYRSGALIHRSDDIVMVCRARKQRCNIILKRQDIDADLLSSEMEFSLQIGDNAYTNYGEWDITEKRRTVNYTYLEPISKIPTIVGSSGRVWM